MKRLNVVKLRKSLNLKQSEFRQRIGLSQSYMSEIEGNKKPITEDILNSIIREFSEGIVFPFLESECDNIAAETKDDVPFTTYLLPMAAMGGSLTGFSEGSMLSDCEVVVSPIKDVDFAITVYGESMSPEYPSGSKILIKRINPTIFIDWGKVFVLDTSNGVIVKEVHKSDSEGYVSCYSINTDPKFKPFDVPLNEVFGMYRVLMCLSAK